LQARLGIDPITLDLRSLSGASDHSAMASPDIMKGNKYKYMSIETKNIKLFIFELELEKSQCKTLLLLDRHLDQERSSNPINPNLIFQFHRSLK